MGMFDMTMSDEAAAQFRKSLVDQAQTKVAEPVIVAAGFRRGGAASKMIASKAGLGGLVYAGLALRNKKKAAGLPERVMLAVTATKLHAFKLKVAREWKAQDEVAVWERADIRVSSERKMSVTMLTIESPGEGEKVTLAPIGVKDDPVGLELIGLLEDGPAESAAGA
jgi:hypothetical protein